jgi:hypothetical protein
VLAAELPLSVALSLDEGVRLTRLRRVDTLSALGRAGLAGDLDERTRQVVRRPDGEDASRHQSEHGHHQEYE